MCEFSFQIQTKKEISTYLFTPTHKHTFIYIYIHIERKKEKVYKNNDKTEYKKQKKKGKTKRNRPMLINSQNIKHAKFLKRICACSKRRNKKIIRKKNIYRKNMFSYLINKYYV